MTATHMGLMKGWQTACIVPCNSTCITMQRWKSTKLCHRASLVLLPVAGLRMYPARRRRRTRQDTSSGTRRKLSLEDHQLRGPTDFRLICQERHLIEAHSALAAQFARALPHLSPLELFDRMIGQQQAN